MAKRIDDLGIEVSQKYAENIKLREEADKYFRKTPALSTKDIIEATLPQTETLLGSFQKKTFASFPEMPPMDTALSAFNEGSLISSIGPSEAFFEKIESAPEKNSKLRKFNEEYKKIDRDCAYAFSHLREFHRG